MNNNNNNLYIRNMSLCMLFYDNDGNERHITIVRFNGEYLWLVEELLEQYKGRFGRFNTFTVSLGTFANETDKSLPATIKPSNNNNTNFDRFRYAIINGIKKYENENNVTIIDRSRYADGVPPPHVFVNGNNNYENAEYENRTFSWYFI